MSNIRGITISLNGDTTGLTDALRDVNKESKNTQKELKEVEKALRMDPGNTELLAQRQQLLTRSIEETRDKLDVLRTAQAQVQQQFERGDIGAEQYRAFQRELAQTEASLRNYDNQLRAMGSEQTRFNQAQQGMQNYLQATGQSIDDLSSTLGSRLTNAIRNGSASSDQLEMALRRLGQAAGHSGDDLQEFQRLLRNVDGSNNLDEIRRDLDRIGDSADQASGKLREIGSSAAAAGGAIAGIGAVGAAAGLVEGTEEANRALAMLEIQADKAGIALEKTQEAQTALGATSHDINQIAETFGNLTQAGYTTEESINQISEALAGARILYGETFSAEGLAESITTTTQLGEVTGQLTDLLEKSGVDVDDFNAKMQSMSSVQERANYISQLLADQGLNAAYQEYAKLNPEIIQQEQANQKLTETLTNLADQLLPLITKITEFATKIAEWVVNNEGLATTLVAIAAVVGTLVTVISTVIPIITAIATAMGVGMAAASGIFLGAIAAVIAIVVAVIAVIQNWSTIWEWLKNVMSSFTDWLSSVFVAAVGILPSIFTAVWTAISTTAQVVWSGIVSFLSSIWTGIVTVATSVFNSLKTGVTNIFNGIKTTATTVWNAIKTAITTAINAIKTGVTTVFNSIKTTVTTVFNAIKSTATSIWNSIKSVITSAVNSVKSTVTSVFNAIKSTVTSVMNGIKSTISNAWNSVKSTVTSAVNGVKSIVTNVFNSLKSVVSSAMTGVRTAITNGWNAAKSFLQSINLASIGRNIIEGLANGISNAVGLVKTAVSKLAGLIPDWAKEMLGIYSPSRVMRDQVGYWVGAGVAAGVDKSQARVAESMRDLGYILIDEADHYASELVKIDEQLAKDKADALTAQNEAIAKLTETADAKILAIKKKASSKKRKLTKDENNQIAKLNKDLWTAQAKETAKYHATIKKLDDKATKDQFKNLQAESKAYLDTIKSFIDDKKSLEQLSMIEEVAIWKNSIGLFEESSKERIQSQQNYKKAVDAVNKEVESINKAHQDRMQTINDNLKKQTEDLTKAYQDEYDKRVDSFKKSAGDTFTALNIEFDVTGTDLTNILVEQVDAITKFDTLIRQLASRGVADELFNEINEAGVKALPELAAIVAMTDEELSRYSALYEQKHRRAVQLATDQLRPLKTATEQQIKELQNVANRELNVLQAEWIEQIESITKATDGELSSLKQVGIDAGQGLFDGLAQMEDPIVRKAREIAQAVSGTIQKALDIHSPSRVMEGFGVNIGQGLIQGMDDMIRKVAQSSTRLNDAILSAQYSLNNSAQKAQQQKVIERQMVQQATPAIDLDSLVQAIAALAQRPVQTTVNMDGREVAQVVSVHQARQTQMAGLTKGVNMR